MPQTLLMHQIKRIIELYHEGRSIWETKRLTGLSRTTIREYLQRMQRSDGGADKSVLPGL